MWCFWLRITSGITSCSTDLTSRDPLYTDVAHMCTYVHTQAADHKSNCYHFCACTVGKTPVSTNVVTREENNQEEKPSPQPSDQDPASSSDITQKTNEPDINLKTQPSPWNTWWNNTQEEALIMRPKTAIKQYGTHLSSDNRKAERHYRLCERNAIRLPVFKVHTSVIPQSTHLQCQL
jgi:hypothetical protein